MLYWLRMIVTYRMAVAARRKGERLPVPVCAAVNLPVMIALWALVVMGVRWLFGL